MSELALKLIREAKEKHLTKLDLGRCGLTELPDELFELSWLEELVLSNSWYERNPSTSRWEEKRSKNNGAWNQFANLPNNLCYLDSLSRLVIAGDQHRKWAMTNVAVLKHLSNLTQLYLSSNQIVDVSPLALLSNLTQLDLSSNQIVDVSPLALLSNLTQLDLRSNQIVDVSPLASLSNLTQLDLFNNQIVDVSPLASLSNLTQLDLRSNQISSLKSLLKIFKKGMPVYWERIYENEEIVVGDNPLESPPKEIIEQGNEAILIYFRNLQEQGAEKLNEAKLIIVGEPEAGKTSLMKKLLNPAYQVPQKEDSTLGIQVREGWRFSRPDDSNISFSANIWDFGGQQIQYMTHQFFLTPGAVYVLVSANDRKETTANFPYWLKIIHLLGEEKGNYSPVVVVQNDKNGQFVSQFDEQFYCKRYPELSISSRTVDLKNEADVASLRDHIQRTLTRLPHVNHDRPARWNDIRNALRQLAKGSETEVGRNHIGFPEYAAICSEHQVTDEQSQLLLSYYLHRLGSLLHFSDDPTLRDFIILNPQWAVDAVYSVLNDNSIAKADGYFTQDQLESIWNGKYSAIEQGKLLSLMKKDNFEICYELNPDEKSYIAPQLLSDRRPYYDWGDTDTLKFRFQYKFMPDGIITRLIVRLNNLIVKGEGCDLVWRKGMVLQENGCRAQVQEEENREGLKVIDIAVSGKSSERKYLLRKVRDEVGKLHKKWFRNIQAEQMIPCNCEVCCKSANPTYFAFDELQQYLDEGENNIKCRNGYIKNVFVWSLLEGVFGQRELVKQDLHRQVKHWPITEEAGGNSHGEEIYPQVPAIHIHNYPHLPAASENVQLPKEEAKSDLVPPTPEAEKWYKQWWVFSVTLGLIAASAAGFWSESWPIAISAGSVVGYLVYLLNTKRRFWRGAMLAFAWLGVSASPPLAVKLGWVDKAPDNNSWFLLESGEPLNIVVTLAVLALIAWFAYLDHKQG